MNLTRRDAIAALGGIGVAAGAGGEVREWMDGIDYENDVLTVLHAAAEAIYPPQVAVDRSFVETYARGRLEDRPGYARAQVATLATLRRHSRRLAGRSFESLDIRGRRRVFRRMGVHRAHPNPDGSDDERVRYYVVNDLLFVLFSTPRGGKLVDCENPPGHPGGLEAYQRGPNA